MQLPWRKKTELDIAIDDVLTRMRVVGPDDDEYKKLVKYLGHLNKMRDESRKSGKVSKDTLAIVLGNVGIVVAVLAYENSHVITTKALDFITKRPR